jgi:hypothetical protein
LIQAWHHQCGNQEAPLSDACGKTCMAEVRLTDGLHLGMILALMQRDASRTAYN